MLVLFDIDGTLLNADGAGRLAMIDAGRELFGEHFTLEGVEIAGRLDPLIYGDAAAQCGVADGSAHHERFRATYRRHLGRRLDQADVRACPGVETLVDGLLACGAVALGLLTGNYPETGRMKLAAAGIDASPFTINAFGSDGGARRDLPPVAFQRYADEHGRRLEPGRVVIIGDTPHDVDCALANGCRSLAVGTGWTSVAELRAAGADLTMDDLRDTAAVLDWIMQNAAV